MAETRKLSTILFADITGYTALMQSDEQKALESLHSFKKTLEECVPSYDGQIVQYFGDACLLSFESTSQAMRCAMKLQSQFQEVEIPVRMGVHLGEVIFTEDNVFGDGVNIASRIESMGVPGAILLSKTVRDQVKNKSEFELADLGAFELKNVNDPLEVFAIANAGFMVPQREEMTGKLKRKETVSRSRWLIPSVIGLTAVIVASIFFLMGSTSPLTPEDKARPVAVMPFENQSMDPNMDAYGLMAMDWISRGLLEAGGARVLKQDEVGETGLYGITSEEELKKRAEILIKGRFYAKDEQRFMITADIVDLHSNSTLYSLDPLIGDKKDPMEVLVALQQKLIGFWKLDGSYQGKPPRYDAYEAHVQASQLKEDHPYPNKIALFQEALELDSHFIEPLFSLYSLSRWGLIQGLREPTYAQLKSFSSPLSPYQKLKQDAVLALHHGDMIRMAEAERKLFRDYKMDVHAIRAITIYRFNNHLNKAVELYENFTPIEPDTIRGELLGRYVNALYGLGRYDDALDAIEASPRRPTFVDYAIVHLRILARQEKFDELDKALAFYKNYPLEYGGYYSISVLITHLCDELYMMDMHDHLPKYLALTDAWFDEVDEQYLFKGAHSARIAFIREDYESMYHHGQQLWDRHQVNFSGEHAGIALLKMGREQEANAYIEALKQRPISYPGVNSYAIGAIEAHRDKEEAMKWLKKAYDEGYEFDWYSHRHDPMLKVLMDHPPFLEFTEPR